MLPVLSLEATNRLNAPEMSAAPLIDGSIADGEWDSASMSPVALDNDGRVTDDQGVFRIGTHGGVLYLAFSAERMGRSASAKVVERDGAAYAEDGFEFFLSRNPNERWQFVANARGAIYDSKGGEAAWDGPWTVKAGPADGEGTGFLVEASIPLAALTSEPAKMGDVWGMQVVYNRNEAVPQATWSRIGDGGSYWMEPGELVFGGSPNRLLFIQRRGDTAKLKISPEDRFQAEVDPAAMRFFAVTSPDGMFVLQNGDMIPMLDRSKAELNFILAADTAGGSGPLGRIRGRLDAAAPSGLEISSTPLVLPVGPKEVALLQATLRDMTEPGDSFETVVAPSGQDAAADDGRLVLKVERVSTAGLGDQTMTVHLARDLRISLAAGRGDEMRNLATFEASASALPLTFSLFWNAKQYAVDFQPPVESTGGEPVGEHGLDKASSAAVRLTGRGPGAITVSRLLLGTATSPDLGAFARGQRSIDPNETSQWELVWSDEFDGEEIDRTVWETNGEHGDIGLDEVSEIRNNGDIKWRINGRLVYLDGKGHLVFEKRKTEEGIYEVPNRVLRTKQRFLHGYYEARVKMITEPGTWSAFWMNPSTGDKDPFTDGFEIDIYEDHMNVPRGDGSRLHHGAHFGVGTEHYRPVGAGKTVIEDWNRFYRIGVEWNPLELIFYVDGKESGRIGHDTGGIGTVPLHIFLSLERATLTRTSWTGDIRKAKLPDHYMIDYVRAYRRVNQPEEKPEVTLRATEGETIHVKEVARNYLDKSLGDELVLTPQVVDSRPIKRAMLFDNGYLLLETGKVPEEYRIELTERWFRENTSYFTPTKSANNMVMGVRSIYKDHSFLLMVEDENGAFSWSKPVLVWLSPPRRQTERERFPKEREPGQAAATDLPIKDGLVMWLRSDRGVETDDSGKVVKWEDLSGKGNSPLMDQAARRPELDTRHTMHGMPAIYFDGKDDFLTFPASIDGFDPSREFTAVLVMRKEFHPEIEEWPRRILAFASSTGSDWNSPDAFAITVSRDNNDRSVEGFLLLQDLGTAEGDPNRGVRAQHIEKSADAIAQGSHVFLKRETAPNEGRASLIREGEVLAEQDYRHREAGNARHTRMTLGADPIGALPSAFELYEVILFDRALSEDELATLQNYLESWRQLP